MKSNTLHMIGNAHIDPVWLWQWQEGFHEVHATFRSALDRMKQYPDFVFVASSAAFYAWVEQSDPAMFAEIQERVKQGRWDIVGGWWIEPDCNIPSGESFARHGLYGQRYFQQKFGIQARTGFNVDSFGHAATLPQILKQCGIEYYAFLRPMPHEKELPARVFWWQSPEGSRLMAFRIPFTYTYWGDNLETHARNCLNELAGQQDEIMCFYGVGNHGGGPTIQHIETIHRLESDPDFPAHIVCSTPEAYFKTVEAKNWPLPVIQGELQHHASGCYAAHSGVKRWNRMAENRLLAAEKWACVADQALSQPYPDDFERAWKNVLFNQFHDIMAGTSIEAAYDDARDTYGEALAIADRSLTFSIQSIARQIAIPTDAHTRPLVVFNPLTWPVKAPVEIETDRWSEGTLLIDDAGEVIPYQSVQSAVTAFRAKLAFTAELPALGYRTYHLRLNETPVQKPSLQSPAQPAPDHVLENERFRLEIDPQTGWISSLRDHRFGVEVFAAPAARPVVIADPHDTWGHGIFRWDEEIGEFQSAQVNLVEHGPAKSVLRAVSRYGESSITQNFILVPGLDRIDVRVTVDWREQHKMLKLRFPLNFYDARVTCEIPYGHIERQPNGDEEPYQSWVDVSGYTTGQSVPYGLSLLNDGKYSLDVRDTPFAENSQASYDIGLTVLRSPVYAHHIPTELEPGRAYPYMDQGIQHFQYTILPHPDGWQQAHTVRSAAELNQPPTAFFTAFHSQGKLPQADTFIAVEPDNVLVSVLKRAEDGHGLVLRAYETDAVAIRATIRLPLWNRVFQADFQPGEIKTFRIPPDATIPVYETSLLE